jgi:hypothetical protein
MLETGFFQFITKRLNLPLWLCDPPVPWADFADAPVLPTPPGRTGIEFDTPGVKAPNLVLSTRAHPFWPMREALLGCASQKVLSGAQLRLLCSQNKPVDASSPSQLRLPHPQRPRQPRDVADRAFFNTDRDAPRSCKCPKRWSVTTLGQSWTQARARARTEHPPCAQQTPATRVV